MRASSVGCVCLALVVAGSNVHAQNASIEVVFFSDDPLQPSPFYVSDEGAVGYSVALHRPYHEDLYNRMIRWSPTGVRQELPMIGARPEDYAFVRNWVASRDGSILAGTIRDDTVPISQCAVRWNEVGEIEVLELFEELSSECYAISADGLVVAGQAYKVVWDVDIQRGVNTPCRWDWAGQMYEFEALPGQYRPSKSAAVWSLSDDGTVAAGWSKLWNRDQGVFIGTYCVSWNPNGFVDLLNGSSAPSLTSGGKVIVSGDGNVIAGPTEDWRIPGTWTPTPLPDDTGPVPLTLPGGIFHASVERMSRDGSLIFARASDSFGVSRSMYWDAARQPHLLEAPEGEFDYEPLASDFAEDGSLFVGFQNTTYQVHAWVSDANGSYLLEDYLTDRGVDLSHWDRLLKATACSDDGKYIVGGGIYDGEYAVFRVNLSADGEPPVIEPGAPVRTYVDKGKLHATLDLPEPEVTDNVPEGVVITSDEKTRYPLGKTIVTWTATDAAGNEATWKQPVTVLNHAPTAKAGKDVTVVADSERGVRLSLDGGRSSDADRHALTFAWSAPGVRLRDGKTPEPSAMFPPGNTSVKLTVKDRAGATDSDVVRVVVRLRNARERRYGVAADHACARTLESAESSPPRTAAAVEGLQWAALAQAYGTAAGRYVIWNDGESFEDALLPYAELRRSQAQCAERSVSSLRTAFAEAGGEGLGEACHEAEKVVVYAYADLLER